MKFVRLTSLALVLGAAALAGGCSFIAKDGPTGLDLRSQAASTTAANPNAVGFVLVDMSPEVMRAANAATNASVSRFGHMDRGAGPDVSIGAGDILNVTVFEAESGGLFIPKEAGSRSGNYVQLPNEQVDASGKIVVPYIDQPIRVLGRTTRDVAKEISQKLAKRAIEPQAVVSVVEHRGNEVSVLGEVNTPQRFSLDPGGTRLLSAIARAGGPKNPAYETIISIQRNNVVQRALMSTIIKEPSQNFNMRPGDVIYLSREPRIFLALGATPSPGSVGGINNRRFSFENDTMNLAEAVGKAGGLDNVRADPREVFLFRFESRKTLESIGTDISRFSSNLIPTVYTIDLSKGTNFFLADSFQIRDKDLIYVSDAPAIDMLKFLTVVNGFTSNVYNSAEAASVIK